MTTRKPRRLLVAHGLCAALAAAATPIEAQTPPASAGPTAASAAPAASAPQAAGAAPTGSVLPPGHPPVAPASPGAAAERGELPAGHPSASGGDAGGQRPPPADRSAPDPKLPPGTVEVTLVDAQERPQANVEVRLGILQQTVAEGEARENKVARSDAQGKARFSGLRTATDFSYRVSVPRGPATYASAPFQFKGEAGQSVLLHLFPVTQDIRSAMVGMRGIILIEPRDDVFQFQVMYRVFNIGQVTWVPSTLTLQLPPDAKGFNAEEGMSDTRFAAESGGRVRLSGTFTPGQHDAQFRFQVPNHGDADVSFRLDLPPHVADLRVIAQSSPGMTLEVDGFDPAQPTVDANGQRLLFTAREMRQGDNPLRELAIRLSGLPTQGPGRWIAVALAAGLAAAGLSAARRAPAQPKKLAREELAAARELLLDELVALERARAAGQIGPRSYESAKRQLVEALARLRIHSDGPERSPRKRARLERPAKAAT